jgi:uncharacterized protein YecE (DUF72 family)
MTGAAERRRRDRATSPARGARPLHPALVGCSGWNYRDWRGTLYPPGLPAARWLERYAQSFGTVEVNATFYRLVARSTVTRWLQQTPPGFLFAVKASRYLTHIRRLVDIGAGVALFYDRIEPMLRARRLACVLWQLPENFHRNDARLAATLAALPPGRHAFEFRHSSWFVPDVYRLLEGHGVALVIGDHPQRPFQTMQATASWRYVRFHYGSHGRGGNYSERELARWAQRLHGWRREGDVYAYFNNDWLSVTSRKPLAVDNALLLKRLLAGLEASTSG